jgi:cation diffusion facilitator CzcD-associated flavoprotein CzcO
MLLQKLPLAADLCVIGGGAAGFYAAISFAERAISNGYRKVPDILILEKSVKLLD